MVPVVVAGRPPTLTVTVMVVTAVFHVQLTFPPQVKPPLMIVPSWSWTSILPVVVPFIASLNVRLNESPASVKSVVARLFTIRASTMVGGVKSPAPVVKIAVAGQTRSLPTVSSTSFAPHVTVTVYVRSAGSVWLRVTLNDCFERVGPL